MFTSGLSLHICFIFPKVRVSYLMSQACTDDPFMKTCRSIMLSRKFPFENSFLEECFYSDSVQFSSVQSLSHA